MLEDEEGEITMTRSYLVRRRPERCQERSGVENESTKCYLTSSARSIRHRSAVLRRIVLPSHFDVL